MSRAAKLYYARVELPMEAAVGDSSWGGTVIEFSGSSKEELLTRIADFSSEVDAVISAVEGL